MNGTNLLKGVRTAQFKIVLCGTVFPHSEKRDVHLMGQCPICPLNVKFLSTTNSGNYYCHTVNEITPLVAEAVLCFPE